MDGPSVFAFFGHGRRRLDFGGQLGKKNGLCGGKGSLAEMWRGREGERIIEANEGSFRRYHGSLNSLILTKLLRTRNR